MATILQAASGQSSSALSGARVLSAPQPVSQTPTDTSQSLSQSLWHGLVGGAKAIASPVATLAARPVQAVAELAGASDTQVNDISSKLSGGLIAPVPENGADLKKDIGRGAETVALGLGPVAGGAAFGVGNSVEQGNALLSPTTAVQTIAGMAGGKILGLIGKPIFNAVGKVVAKITPDFLQSVATKGTSAITDFAAEHNILPGSVSHVINAGADVAEAVANKPFDAVSNSAKAGAEFAQRKIAVGDVPGMGQNVPENVQTSAERLAKQAPLIGAGAAREATPLDMYNAAAHAEEAAKADVKNPDAGQMLGTEHITPVFEKVIKMRSSAGKAMQAELDNPVVGGIKTNVSVPRQNLLDELSKQKLNYNAKDGTLNQTGVSPLGKGDRSIIESYVKDLHSLGDTPTVEDVNNFIRGQVDDLNLYNKKVGGTTNAERIVQGNLKALRGTISAKATGNAALKPYSDAKAQVADLSKTIEFGSPLLGKKDLSGNYVRDSSVAKRAIQSLADGGSRDFLLNLERHTGEPLLDRALLTLQAMKDAGNPMGHSLLESVVNQGKDVPLEAQGLNERIVRGLAGYAKGKVVGSPADQTRAYLKSLGKRK